MIGEYAVLAIGKIKQKSEEYEDILVEIIVNCTGRSDDFLQGKTEKNLRKRYSSSTLERTLSLILHLLGTQDYE